MWATRDQENLVHNQQTIAAAKPLNQGAKLFNPKTPGNKGSKTPFKPPLNDENSTVNFGDGRAKLGTNGKGIANQSSKTLKDKSLDKSAFVTPSGPRNRAPLGAKTTNAKARSFKTPGGPGTGADQFSKIYKQQPRSASTRKPKSQVIRSESVKVEGLGPADEQAEKEVEYTQPYAKALPDDPEDFPPDLDFSILNPANQTRSFFRYFSGQEDDLRRQEAAREEAFKAQDEFMDKEIANMKFPGIDGQGGKVEKKAGASKQPTKTNPKRKLQIHRTVYNDQTSISAGSAGPRVTAACSRQAASLLSNKIAPVAPRPKQIGGGSKCSSMRPIVSAPGPKALSTKPNTFGSTGTISYAKGRAVSRLLAPSSAAQTTFDKRQSPSEPTEESTLIDFERALAKRQFAVEEEEDARMRLPIFSELLKEEADEGFQLNISWNDGNEAESSAA
ncbi:MAG: hypothetical protein M1814_003929 [Vezdaea aestivalis]|nr:MAG: hypothetical protein M1814_003929 [Vezdaea aestivalis]